MLARLRMLWVAARDSLWFVPGVLTLGAVALALLTIALEKQGVVAVGDPDHWLFGGGAEGARGVLSAIAGGLITVTGVVFSVTIVALQLASSQFTPRVLRNFTADRSNQVVLGVFIGTFTYTLLVLRVVRSDTAAEEAFVPRLSVALAMLLVLVSVGFLIYFINHASRSIQISVILERVTRQTLRHVERLFPRTVGRPLVDQAPADAIPSDRPAEIASTDSGYLQAVDAAALFELGRTRELVIRMERQIGEYILPGRILASLWPAEAIDDEVVRRIQRAFVVGPERTPEQDLEFGIVEIADIAVKALSPSINDPSTAFQCIDRLSEILLALGSRDPPPDLRTEEGRIHFIARPLRFERAVGLAFDQIRHFGADNHAIVKRLLDALSQLQELLPEERQAPIAAQREAVISDADGAIESDVERPDVERVGRKVRAEPAERRGRGTGAGAPSHVAADRTGR